MTTWVKQLFSSTDKALDILNVGRMIFFTAGGFMAIYPATMIIKLLGSTTGASGKNIFESMKANVGLLDSWMLFFVSLITGFVIAQLVFTVILTPLFQTVREDLKDTPINVKGFNFQYPSLKNDDGEDYQAWLISEYFRYIEIGTILPVGFAAGLITLDLYGFIYLLFFGVALPMSNIVSAIVFLIATSTLVAALIFHVWPLFWKPVIVGRTVATYFGAKYQLIAGVDNYRSLQNADKAGKI